MQRAPKILLLAGLALALGLAIHLGIQRSPRAGTALLPAPDAVELRADDRVFASAAIDALDSAPASPSQAARETLAPARIEFPTWPAAQRPLVLTRRQLSGTVSVIDPDGNPVGGARGEFFLAFQEGGARLQTRHVPFEDGVWSASLEVSDEWRSLAIRAPKVYGRVATLEEPEGELAFPYEGELTIVVRASRPASLRVVDAATGIDLDEVCLVRDQGYGPLSGLHSGAEGPDCHIERRSSPVALDPHPALLNASQILVGAPGYSWQRVRRDPAVGGERLVLLERGAELLVQVVAAEELRRAKLRLYEVGSSVRYLEEQIPLDGAFALAGLRPGTYRIAVEAGERHSSPLVLAEQRLELAAGERAQVHLVCFLPADAPRAPAAGIVVVPEAWGIERLDITLRPLGSDGSRRGDPRHVSAQPVAAQRPGLGSFEWSVQDLEVGAFLLEVDSPPFSARLEQPPGGRSDLLVELPPPLELRVRVVEAPGGETFTRGPLHWYPSHPGTAPRFSFPRAASWNPDSAEWVIRAPAGPILLTVQVPPGRIHRETIELVTDRQEHVIALEGAAGVRLYLRDAGTPVDFPSDSAPRLSPLAHSGKVIGTGTAPFEVLILVDAPGSYRVDLPKISGYRQPAAVLLEIEEGRVIDHRVELERERP